MGYRAIIEAVPETIQDLEISAYRRLDEAVALFISNQYHTAIYIAGLAAEMYLKTACYDLRGAKPTDLSRNYLIMFDRRKYKPPFAADFNSGHGLWFWSQEIILRRQKQGLRKAPRRFLQVMASIYNDWFIGMRYRPGMATTDDASRFIAQVEWLANNHAALRS